MPNKEQKKFKEVIKKRRKRLVRLARRNLPKYKFIEMPQPVITIKQSWWKRLLKFLRIIK